MRLKHIVVFIGLPLLVVLSLALLTFRSTSPRADESSALAAGTISHPAKPNQKTVFKVFGVDPFGTASALPGAKCKRPTDYDRNNFALAHLDDRFGVIQCSWKSGGNKLTAVFVDDDRVPSLRNQLGEIAVEIPDLVGRPSEDKALGVLSRMQEEYGPPIKQDHHTMDGLHEWSMAIQPQVCNSDRTLCHEGLLLIKIFPSWRDYVALDYVDGTVVKEAQRIIGAMTQESGAALVPR